MDVRQDAAAGDGDGAQELVQLLVVADGELDVARDDGCFKCVGMSVNIRLRYIIIIIIGDADASVDAGRRNLYMSQQQQQPTRIVLCTWPRGGDFCDHPRFYMNELP